MSTQESLPSIIRSFHTGALELSSSLSALCNDFRNKCPRKPSTRQQPDPPAAKLSMTVLDAWNFLDNLDALSGQVQVMILQAKEAENVMVTSHGQVMDNATNALQMDTRSETSCERQIDTQLGISEQEATSDSQSSETSSSQPTQTFDDPQPVESEDVTMAGSDLAAADSPPDSPKEGGDDINVRRVVTPSPDSRSVRADLNTSQEGRSFARSHSVVTESSAASMTVDTSPAGSVATHITWPESSGRSADEDEAMLDVDDTRDGMQKRQPDLGGLKRIADSVPGQDLATGDKPSSPAPSPVAEDRTGQPTQSPRVSERAISSESQNLTAHTEAELHGDRLASPPVNGDIRRNEDSRADDFTQEMDSAMDMLAAAGEQGHSPGSGDEQRIGDQQTESSSTGACEQDTTMLGVETTDDDQSRDCPAGGLNATPAETNIIQPSQGPTANETISMADSMVDIEANSAPRTLQGHPTNDEADSPGSRQSPAAGDTDIQGNADQRDTGPQSRLPTLSPADMKRLISKIQELEAQGCGQHVAVPRVDVDLESVRKSIDTGEWRCTAMVYKAGRKGEGYVSIYARMPNDQPLIDWPAFSAEFTRPTIEEAKAVFEDTVQNPPKGKVPYYIGHADILSEQALDPGPLITGNSDLKDIHTNYHHIGGHLSGNRIHCEDFTYLEETDEGPVWRGLRSFNEVYLGTGWKLWLVIPKRHIAKFDAFVRKTWQCRGCIGGISHQCLFLAPSSLEKAGIDYNIYVVGCGEAVWTLPGQQHSIINVGHCAARSMNFLYPGESIDFKKLAHCRECNQHPLSEQYGIPLVSREPDWKRKQHQTHSHLPWKKTRTNTTLRRELVEIEQGLAGIPYRRINIDRQHPSTAEVKVYKRVAAVRSTMAIQQFITLVKDWKNEEATVHINKAQDKLNQSVESVKFFERKTNLSKFGLRLTQRKLAREADMAKGPIQRQLETGLLDKLAAAHCMTKKRLKDHIEDGRQWNFICKSHDGLLPFIFLDSKNPFGIKKDNWANLCRKENEADADAFRSLLDDEYTRNLCEAGRIFEERVLEKIFNGSVSDTGGFVWEGTELDVDSENIEELLKQVARREGT
ncbi:hypothetical protein J7337_013201 [Fusarium musae]|uniref:JmjC domain-containing protein n=1 Tax=Fusarium musae TaxID=1042133 RepID=A0A9P8D438_9HYPO|nr:hypothetical protein J7337_013201 [Fusarium musae]KAG9494972.1 hypothetical protein J7337_013201 [Fusarium musae]